jgi:hypothetical protein
MPTRRSTGSGFARILLARSLASPAPQNATEPLQSRAVANPVTPPNSNVANSGMARIDMGASLRVRP